MYYNAIYSGYRLPMTWPFMGAVGSTAMAPQPQPTALAPQQQLVLAPRPAQRRRYILSKKKNFNRFEHFNGRAFCHQNILIFSYCTHPVPTQIHSFFFTITKLYK